MKKGILSIIFFLIMLTSVSALTFKKYYDSSRYYIKFNNNLLTNPAFTGFNNHFVLSNGIGFYTPDIPAIEGTNKPKDYHYSAEISFGKLLSYSFGLSRMIKDEAAFSSEDLNVAFSISLQTLKFGNFRIGVSASSYSYGLDFSKLTFGDMINPKLGFIYPTQEVLPANDEYWLSLERYNAGFFYSYKNIFYLGYSKLDINEPLISFYEDNQITLHAKTVITAGGDIPVNKDFDISVSALIQKTSYYDITQIKPSLGLGYKSKYYFSGGINLINSDLISYFIQLDANICNFATIAFNYELLKDNYFSNSLSPSFLGISSSIYIDRFIKYKK